ncbi:uncharacterized protein LOC102452322 isoform X1 [Pelodiscus sinensis]|uniref:uncharacterized protein LOC102452322 isoform X1 n=1 Tax=Pelodiscus sinensis TaxID=13735 RepID=UPI003F6B3542
MAWRLLLALAGGLLAAAASGGHRSLAVLVTGVHEEGINDFTMSTLVDGVRVAHYSSRTREVRPTQGWAAQALDAGFLQKKTQEFWGHEEGSKAQTQRWMQLYNQTGGVHTEQLHARCALGDQTPNYLRFQYAYDGQDFISFDLQTGTWVAAVQPAVFQKQYWETHKIWTRYVQWFLQHECLEILRSLVQQGQGVLERQAVSLPSAPRGLGVPQSRPPRPRHPLLPCQRLPPASHPPLLGAGRRRRPGRDELQRDPAPRRRHLPHPVVPGDRPAAGRAPLRLPGGAQQPARARPRLGPSQTRLHPGSHKAGRRFGLQLGLGNRDQQRGIPELGAALPCWPAGPCPVTPPAGGSLLQLVHPSPTPGTFSPALPQLPPEGLGHSVSGPCPGQSRPLPFGRAAAGGGSPAGPGWGKGAPRGRRAGLDPKLSLGSKNVYFSICVCVCVCV